MNDKPQNSALRRYRAVLRRRGWLIGLIVVLGIAVAVGLSLLETKTYSASTSVQFLDPSQVVGVAGLPPTQGDLPAQIAAQGAETATRPAVLRAVRARLQLNESVNHLRSRITASADAQSNLVNITVTAPQAVAAARLANAVAFTAARAANRELRAQYAKAARALTSQPQSGSSARAGSQARFKDQAARLQILATVGHVANVVDSASIPRSPSSPKPVSNAVLGGLLGALLALILVGILESLDRRLRRADEAEEIVGLPLVGAVPDSLMGSVPTTAVEGEPVAAMDTFRMLRNNISLFNIDNPPTTVVVTSPTAAEGKTTVATGLAFAAASGGKRTLLVEADLHRPVDAARLGLERAPGLTDYLVGDASPAEILQTHDFVDPDLSRRANGAEAARSQLVCITAGTSTGWSPEVLGSERFASFIRQVGKVYDLVVIDSPPLLAVSETIQLVQYADALLYCLRLNQSTVEQAKAGRELLSRLPDPPDSGLVLTGIRHGDDYSYPAYGYAYDYGSERSKRKLPTRVA